MNTVVAVAYSERIYAYSHVHLYTYIILLCGPGSSVGITTDYGLEVPGSNLLDYIDFLRRARWKSFRAASRREQIGNYLAINLMCG